MADVTNSGCTDPVQRMQKLNEWRQQLEDSIAQKQDRQYLIEHEISECQKEITKRSTAENCHD